MKKISVVGCFLVGITASVPYLACGHGGDAFAGSLGGSLLGSAIGTSMAQKSSHGGGDGSGAQAFKEIGKLEEAVRNDLRTLNGRIDDLEEDVKDLQKDDDSKELREELATLKKTFGDIEKKMDEQSVKIEERLVALEGKSTEPKVERKAVEEPLAVPVEKTEPEEK